jgi:uncharacterized membrane protein
MHPNSPFVGDFSPSSPFFSLVSEALPDPAREPAREVERWASFVTGAAVMAFGLSRRSVSGVCLAVAAAPLAYKGLTGEWPVSSRQRDANDVTRAALGGPRGIHVRESIRLEVPIEQVYQFWRRLENLPRFMAHLERVEDLGGGQSHWIAKGPVGVPVEWGAEIINEVENKIIGWRSLPDSDITTAGAVNFSTVRDGRSTQLSVHLQYSAPAGRAGQFLATIFGSDPASMIREDLRCVKQLLEAGEIARASKEPGR